MYSDMEDLKIFAKESGSPEPNDLTHWDLTFWSERLRESKYDINEVFFYFALFMYLIIAASCKVSFTVLSTFSLLMFHCISICSLVLEGISNALMLIC